MQSDDTTTLSSYTQRTEVHPSSTHCEMTWMRCYGQND